jgi:MoaA/NifB/PqqE/SkfB family radical SAM enzyme
MTPIPVIFADKKYSNKVCLEPFGTIEITEKGDVRICACGAWMPTIIGNVFENTIDEILNNTLAIKIRDSIRDGSFRYCNEEACGIITNNQLYDIKDCNTNADPRWALFKDETKAKTIKKYFIAGDRTCNLSCPSCRTKVIKNSYKSIEKLKTISNTFNKHLLDSTVNNDRVEIRLSTSGEVFASPLLLNFLAEFPIERFPNVVFYLQTNGLLVKKKWEKIKKISKNIENITITADSCSKIIYEKLRRGGAYEDLVENLEFISKLGIKFNIRMVIQRDNCNEIANFYTWAKSFGAENVEYIRITNWGTYTLDEFFNIDVLNKNNILYNSTAQQLIELKNNHNNVIFYGFNV